MASLNLLHPKIHPGPQKLEGEKELYCKAVCNTMIYAPVGTPLKHFTKRICSDIVEDRQPLPFFAN